MVGPFMQAMLLLGIIYWYSKGMMNLINDYYRSEFQRKLKIEDQQSQGDSYDTEDMGKLIKTEILLTAKEQPIAIRKQAKLKSAVNLEFCARQSNWKIFQQLLKDYIDEYELKKEETAALDALYYEHNKLPKHTEL